MRRRTCHGLSRSFGERPLETSNTKTRPRRWLDRLSPLRRRHRVTTTTAPAPAGRPVVCTGSLTYLFKVRKEAGGNPLDVCLSLQRHTISGFFSANWEPSSKLSIWFECQLRSEPVAAVFIPFGFQTNIFFFFFPRFGCL